MIRPETFIPCQREVFGVEPAIGDGFLQPALFLRDAGGCRPAAFTLRDPRLDLFGRVESHVRA